MLGTLLLLKISIVEDPSQNIINTPQRKDNDSETPNRRRAAADVATPRPREVGGACRIQVLAAARTQETVGGPNGAKRSEFRRRCPPVRVKQNLKKTAGTGWPWQFSDMISNP